MRAPETEFEDLEALLREDRPAPDPAWARGLDAKVAAGFPRRRRGGWTLPSLHVNQALAVAACGLLALVIGIAALSAGESDEYEGAGGGGASGNVPMGEATGGGEATNGSTGRGEVASDSAGGGAARGRASSGETATDADLQETARNDAKAEPSVGVLAAPPVPGPGGLRGEARDRRYVEKSAQLSLAARPRDVDAVATGVARTATELGGYVASSNVSSREGGLIDLRIPSARLDRAIDRLSGLGKVRNLTRASVDITAGVVSAKSRLRDARTERSSLLRQLAVATTPNETASIRARLRIVSREIEARKADVRRTTRRATFASVGVELHAETGLAAGGDDDGSWTPGDAARDAVRVLEVAVGVLLIALAIAIPAGLVALLAVLASRVITRRRRERALDLA